MGGVTHAKDVVFKALKKGKHVVTANKALLAQLLPEVRVAVLETDGTAVPPAPVAVINFRKTI